MGSGSGVSAFIFPNLILGHFSHFGVTVKCWLLIGCKKYRFLFGSMVGVYLVMTIQYATSEVLNWWLDLFAVPFSFELLPGSLLGVSFGLPPWLAPSKVLLGCLLFWIYRLGFPMIPCVHALILLKGLQVLYYIVHRIDLVRHGKLYPWKTSVTSEMFWGGILLCLIFVLLLSWGFMFCDTCSVSFLVLCTSRLLHEAPTMHNNVVCYK